jgi:hypothetical protein
MKQFAADQEAIPTVLWVGEVATLCNPRLKVQRLLCNATAVRAAVLGLRQLILRSLHRVRTA